MRSRVDKVLNSRALVTAISAPCLVLLLSCLLVNTGLQGQSVSWRDPLAGIPLLNSYDLPPTRNNGEVWAFASAGDGQMWVGSDELFLFNGESRERIALPNDAYAVRALAYDKSGKLWVGTIGDIGHLERTSTGSWTYQSAREMLMAAGISEFRVWEAMASGNGMLFVTDIGVIQIDEKGARLANKAHYTRFLVNKEKRAIWLSEEDKEQSRELSQLLEDGTVRHIALDQLPRETLITWALGGRNRSEANTELPLLVGSLQAVYRRDGDSWKKLEKLSALIAGRIPLRAVLLDDDTVAIGSLLGGVVIASLDDQILSVIDRSCGLPNEAVTSLWLDETAGQLWIGYIGGMSRVDARGRASIFDGRNGLIDAPPLKTVLLGDRTLALSRRAIFEITGGVGGKPASARQLVKLVSPLADAAVADGRLWLGVTGLSLSQLIGNKVRMGAPVAGYNLRLMSGVGTSSELIFADDLRLKALVRKGEDSFEVRDLETKLGAIAISTVSQIPGELWVATVSRGIFRFAVHESETGVRLSLLRHFESEKGLPSAILKRPTLTAVGRKLFLLSELGIYAYDAGADAFVLEPKLADFLGLAGCGAGDAGIAYWIVQNRRSDPSASDSMALIRVRLDSSGSELMWEPLESSGLGSVGRIGGISYTGGSSPALWVQGSKDMLRYSISSLTGPMPPPGLSLRGIECNGRSLSIPPVGESLRLSTLTTHLKIELAGSKRTDGKPLMLQAALLGVSTEWSPLQAGDSFSYTGLAPGAYTFMARAVDQFGSVGAVLRMEFVLPPPWYRTVPALIAYWLLFAVLIVVGVRWRMRHLRRQNERLNDLVDKRTAELARANIARNEFLEAISHEIKNPLNGITNLVDLLHDARLDPEARKLAESLGRSAGHLKQVFGDVLDYTKLEYGHVGLDSVEFQLRPLLEDTLALFMVQARELGTELHLAMSSDFSDGFRGDANKLQTIISNFLSNALKYAPGGQIHVQVRVSHAGLPERKSLVWIGVRDQGPGLSLEEQTKLFRKFARGEDAKNKRISGTGLGLAICRGIADLLDGKVGIESQPGAGATFWLELPLEQVCLKAAAGTTGQSAVPPPEGSAVLIVDDQEYNQAVLRGIARRLGYHADLASSAVEVWPLVEQKRFEVVFLDWELPGMTGDEIARQLRQHPNTLGAVIIATTAHDSTEIVQRCLDAGMDGFAAKPFDTKHMRAILCEAVARRAGSLPGGQGPGGANEAMQDSSTTLTLSAFSDFAAGNPEKAEKAVALYVEALEAEISSLVAAVAAGDREVIARHAHRLRSHAGLVNALALNRAAQQLMLAARSGDSESWRQHIEPVLSEASSLKTEIERLNADPNR